MAEHEGHAHAGRPHGHGSDRNRYIVLFVVIVGVVVAGIVGYVEYQKYYQPLQTINFGGQIISFRADLREAHSVPVLPDENAVYDHITKLPVQTDASGNTVYRAPLTNITIVFDPNGVPKEQMGYYSVEGYEIVNKLTALYKGQYGIDVGFNVTPVDNYSGLAGSPTDPVIALVHPAIANGTFVSVDPDREVITVSGGKTLHDFDLATVRFISVALGLQI